MPRTIWSGAISFGLVTVPINVVSATEDHSIHFHQYHLQDMGRIRTRKVCEIEDREVSQAEIGKGYELTKTQVIPITDEELRDLPLPTAKAIEIEAFVPLESVNPIRIAEGYYLQPAGQVAAKPYKLLRQALERSSKVAVAKYAWSGRERLGLLRVRGDAIVLHAMRWPDEIRDPAELLPPAVEVSEGEIEGALALMESMTREDLEGEEFHDAYTEAVAKIIESKRENKPLPEAPEPKEQGQVLDLMAALQESVRKAQASRGETAETDADVHDLEPKKTAPAKKTTAKKTSAKKTAAGEAKKTSAAKKTAKKTAARRPRSA
ncbi:non-homologous end joining protein Ku [Streptomyces rishiriensis]|uniref:non-homologous end joining protein Ku n=1 Tax=Streptomyces rishiriensis TaxID=68264 RepID=UPI0037D20C31